MEVENELKHNQRQFVETHKAIAMFKHGASLGASANRRGQD
jgi:hypothetical protein